MANQPKKPLVNGKLPDKFSGYTTAQLREFLKCRVRQHAWDDYTSALVRNKRTRRQQIRVVLQCDRCESLRVEMLTLATGDRISNPVYHHSEGYRLAKGEKFTAADRAALRLYLVSKTKITVEEEE
jgi:hypothetical protein